MPEIGFVLPPEARLPPASGGLFMLNWCWLVTRAHSPNSQQTRCQHITNLRLF
nr:MAG TPA: hypothetical protein [Bacteriophage sp.]